jgi:putative transposase
MDTHYHLVLQPMLGEVSAGMRVVNGAHSRAFNKRHGRRGALFEARYTERTIRDEEHLAAAIAYVQHNAVAAGMVDAVTDWPWTTHPGCDLHRALSPYLKGV